MDGRWLSLHVLLALRGPPCSRALLARRAGETGSRVRSVLARLKGAGLVSSSRRGHALTEAGAAALDEAGLVGPVPVDAGRLTVGRRDAALLVRGGSARVRSGIEQRDAAILAGCLGATTLVVERGRLRLPSAGAVPPDVAERLLAALPARSGDALVVGTGAHAWSARRACSAAALTLVPRAAATWGRKGKRF